MDAPGGNFALKPSVVAGIDLGSNSFHMIVMRAETDGRVHVLDRLREPVRLAAGLNKNQELSADAQKRGLDALERFGQRLKEFPAGAVRAVGTNTLRKAKNGQDFLQRGRELLGHRINIISGPEEARLIYLGVAHSNFFEGGRRFVMDIGGGSTEFIVGEGYDPIIRNSTYMGCVSYSQRFFAKGKLTDKAFKKAELAASLEMRAIRETYRNTGWARATGASGTIRAVGRVLIENGWSEQGITLEGLDKLKQALIDMKRLERVALPGLEADRAPVFPGGIAILHAAFTNMGIGVMDVSKGALREGVAYELLGRSALGDIRDQTARTFAERYKVDLLHADRVHATCTHLFEQVKHTWNIGDYRGKKFLLWSALTHEIGLSISFSGYQKHDAYIVENSDMPGFSREQKRMLAAILKNHRRRFRKKDFAGLAPDRQEDAKGLAVILRIAVALHRSRTAEALPIFEVDAPDEKSICLRFPEGWLENKPLTKADLLQEARYLEDSGLKLSFY